MNDIFIAEMDALPVPMGDAETAERLCAYIHARKEEILAAVRAVKVTKHNWGSDGVKSALAALKEAIEDLREKGKRLVADACAATDAKRVLTQIDPRLWSFKLKADPLCAYAVLDAEYKALKAKVDAFKEAATPPAPRHTYILAVECTDKALAAIFKAVEKNGGALLGHCAPQSDDAASTFQKLIKENS